MTPDNFDEFMPQPVRRRGPATRSILFAGVAGACVLGVGLGLWARPAMNERRMAVAAPEAPVKPVAPTRKLEIVVDDLPAPIGAPIEVLSKAPGGPSQIVRPGPPPEPEPQAPTRPPQGLMRVQATTVPTQVPNPRSNAALVPALAAPKLAIAKASPAPPIRVAKAEPAPAIPSRKADLAIAQAAKAHRIELARAEAAAHKAQLARAETAKAHKLELAKAAKAARQDQLRLAKAEAKGRAEARAEAKAEALAQARQEARSRTQLASLVHTLARAAHHKAKPQEPPPAQLAKLAKLDRKSKARHELKVEWASARKPPRRVEPSYRAHAVQSAPQPGSGLMRVSTTPRCTSRDAGAALVCADPSLGAADRQLARAYQGARAAGVPDAQLQRQQQRWLAARSAAAREAPWAVHDVYLARIAELNGQAHDAHGDGY